MEQKTYFPGHITKMMLSIRIKSMRVECGLTYDLPFDWKKQSRNFLVSYHNQLIDTYHINTNIFEQLHPPGLGT